MGAVKWHGAEFDRQLRLAMADGMRNALQFMTARLKAVIGRQGPPRSKPGQTPRKETGFLQSQIYWDLDEQELVGQIGLGEEAIYGLYLEKGTRDGRIKPRPWILRTLLAHWNTFARLATGGRKR